MVAHRRRFLFRLLLIAAQAIAIVLTWRLWEPRQSPPNLPVFDWELPQFPSHWLLLATLALVLIRPLFGIALHTLALVAAIACDQLRIQPEFVSLAILLWATLPSAGTQWIGRCHLFSMWFYAGLHKLLSVGYWNGVGAALVQSALPKLGAQAATALAVGAAVVEISLAVLICFPRTRPAAAWTACVFHLGILCYLLGRRWNWAVWPWNAALAFAGFALILAWRDSVWQSIRAAPPWSVAVGALLVVLPAGYYLDLTDAYLAHCVYAANTPYAFVQSDVVSETSPADDPHAVLEWGRIDEATLPTLAVPFPPAHRLYDAYYRRTARPGRRLIVHDPRRWAAWRGYAERELSFSGRWIEHYADGSRKSESNWRSGRKEGDYAAWHPGGAKHEEGRYEQGEKTGPWSISSADGRLEAQGTYHADRMVGAWQFRVGDNEMTEFDFGPADATDAAVD